MKVSKTNNYIFGPVPSRRLGLSLGVDIVPFKLCTLDCIYCQLGKTTKKTIERKEYVPIANVLAELKNRLSQSPQPDYITISGSGEPTLNSSLGEFIEKIKKISDIPVAILTNGSLLYLPDVRKDCSKADVVLPSLDAADGATFRQINRPHPDINIEKHISGLVAFRKEFKGLLWLEVFIVPGVNTSQGQLKAIKKTIQLINPDKIHLNTAVRPTTEPGIVKADAEMLNRIAQMLGPGCEVIADIPQKPEKDFKKLIVPELDIHSNSIRETLLSMLKRRPCSANDIAYSLQLDFDYVQKQLELLLKSDLIASENRNGKTFFKAKQ